MSTPISAITAMAKGSIGAVRTPTESTKTRRPCSLRISAAAIGERMELRVQAKSTLLGNRAIHLAPDMQDAKQREKPPRGVVVHHDAIGEALDELLAALIVQPPAPHIDHLDLGRARLAHRAVIAAADHEIVFDQLAERQKRQHHLLERLVLGVADIEPQPVLGDAQMNVEWTLDRRHRREVIVGKQIADRDLALMLDIGVAADDGVFVERDLRDTLVT